MCSMYRHIRCHLRPSDKLLALCSFIDGKYGFSTFGRISAVKSKDLDSSMYFIVDSENGDCMVVVVVFTVVVVVVVVGVVVGVLFISAATWDKRARPQVSLLLSQRKK